MQLHLTRTELETLKTHAPEVYFDVTMAPLIETTASMHNMYFHYDVPVKVWHEALNRLEAIEEELEA